jgi:hypothetical protein
MADVYEVIGNIAKEILIKAMDQSNHLNIFRMEKEYPNGTVLANHLGDCYKILHDKISAAIKGR